VKNIELMTVTAAELGNSDPSVGTEIVIRGARYCIVEVKAPKVRSVRWSKKAKSGDDRIWTLLVEKIEYE
jgi:hypothetical protein